MENNIKLSSLLESDTILFPLEAEKLFSIIKPLIENKQKVTLDFGGLEDISSLFLNSFFGKLIPLCREDFDQMISIESIDEEHEIFNEMIEQAIFLAKNPRHNVSSRHLAFAG